MNIEASRSCEFAEKEIFKLKLRHLILVRNYRFADPYATRSVPIYNVHATLDSVHESQKSPISIRPIANGLATRWDRPRPSMRLPYERFFGNLGMHNFLSPQSYSFIPPSADCHATISACQPSVYKLVTIIDLYR